MKALAKFFVVLGVSHGVQGDPDFDGAFPDPDYAVVVRGIISNDKIDFVGEECGDNATIANKAAQNLLGAGRYLNVNPSIQDTERSGLGETGHGSPLTAPPVNYWDVAKNEELEQIWVDQVVEGTAARGLLICGFLHAFSVAAKLLNRGFEVEARTYIPWRKLAS